MLKLTSQTYKHTSFFVQVTTVMFDKTGTLSTGRPEVTQVVLFVSESVYPWQLFTAIVGLAESHSEHPLGAAIVNFAKKVQYIETEREGGRWNCLCFSCAVFRR